MKISGLILTENEAPYYLKECIESALKVCDELIIVDSDGRDTPHIYKWFDGDERIKTVIRPFDNPTDYTGNRNYGRQFCKGDYIFNLDADEILGDQSYLIRRTLEENPGIEAWDLQGEHFIYHLGLVDNSVKEHTWLVRIHKNLDRISYPSNTMHGLPTGWKTQRRIPGTQIFHMGYIKHETKRIIEKYHKNMKYREMHTEEYLKDYKNAHLFGEYPVRPFNKALLPMELKELFKLEDEIYAEARTN
ncbi:MAG TPA: glycosyltransferase [bacterium]|nr:glycosyltransferase [bacterium]